MFTCPACLRSADRETGVPRTVFVDVYCHRCQGSVTEQVALDAKTVDVAYEVQRGLV